MGVSITGVTSSDRTDVDVRLDFYRESGTEAPGPGRGRCVVTVALWTRAVMEAVVKGVHILMKGCIFKQSRWNLLMQQTWDMRRPMGSVLADSTHLGFWLCRSEGKAVGLRVHCQCVNFPLSPPSTLAGVFPLTNLLVTL